MNALHNNNNKLTLDEILLELNANIKKNNELLDSLITNNNKVKERESSSVHITDDVYVSKLGSFLRNYIPFIGEYLKKRYENSSLMHFVEGIDLSSDDVDTIVNMFTLVQALLLTISPSLMLSLQGTKETIQLL